MVGVDEQRILRRRRFQRSAVSRQHRGELVEGIGKAVAFGAQDRTRKEAFRAERGAMKADIFDAMTTIAQRFHAADQRIGLRDLGRPLTDAVGQVLIAIQAPESTERQCRDDGGQDRQRQ